jgi:adsorption protein B
VFVVDPLTAAGPAGRGRWLFDSAVAVKEYFPKSFKRAVRQKTRWILGNTLQGWIRLGWPGDFAMRYAFLRDRKVLLGHLAVGVAYTAILLTLALWGARWAVLGDDRLPPVVREDTLLELLVYVNLVFLALYTAMRAYSTFLVYGPVQALLSVPRILWGALINWLAAVRAIYIFFFRSGTVKWDKTEHEFPDEPG